MFFFRATNESNILLKEKLDSCQNKLKRAEEKLKNHSQLEVECEVSKTFQYYSHVVIIGRIYPYGLVVASEIFSGVCTWIPTDVQN